MPETTGKALAFGEQIEKQGEATGYCGPVTRFIYRHFKLRERETDIMTEFRAGTASFLTMAYILLVNPQVLGAPHTGISREDVVVATALASAVACFIVGMFGNLPFCLAPGLGLSAYFSYGLVRGDGLSWESALTSCLLAGIIMLTMALTHTSNAIMMIIPKTIKLATVVGMGLLLTFIGMQSIHLVTASEDSLVRLGDVFGDFGVWLSMGGLMLLSTLTYHGVKGAVLIGILLVTVIVWASNDSWPTQVVDTPRVETAFFVVDFTDLTVQNIPGVLAFLFVGIFDVSGVLFGLAKLSQLVSEDGKIEGSIWAFVGSSVGTVVAACFGCSPIIIHVESVAGIKEGGRTGLTAVFVSMWFLLSLFFAPLFGMVPPEATAPVLVLIGAMMMGEATEIEWREMDQAIPAFLTVVMMPFTFSIPNGIVFGMVSSLVLFFTTGNFLKYCRPRKADQDDEAAWLMRDPLANSTYGSQGSAPREIGIREPSFVESFGLTEPYQRQPSLILRREEYSPSRPLSAGAPKLPK